MSWTIRSFPWVDRKQYYKGRRKFLRSNINWRKACCDLALPCIRRIATIFIICVSNREINSEPHYQGNPWCNVWVSIRWIFACILLHQQKNGKILLATFKRHGIYPMLSAQSMTNILEFNVQNKMEPFFIIIKDSSVLYSWQLVSLTFLTFSRK